MKDDCVTPRLVDDWHVLDVLCALAKAAPRLQMNMDLGIRLLMVHREDGCGGDSDGTAYPQTF